MCSSRGTLLSVLCQSHYHYHIRVERVIRRVRVCDRMCFCDRMCNKIVRIRV